jgi:hypothetical protein
MARFPDAIQDRFAGTAVHIDRITVTKNDGTSPEAQALVRITAGPVSDIIGSAYIVDEGVEAVLDDESGNRLLKLIKEYGVKSVTLRLELKEANPQQ